MNDVCVYNVCLIFHRQKTMANLDTECRKMFEMSAASKAQKSGTVDKKSCKSDAINKIVKETFGAEAARKCDASVFPKHCNKV